MLIDSNHASEIFESAFGDRCGSPYLHPAYVIADSKRDAALTPTFFLFRERQAIFYYAFHLSCVPGESDLFDIQSPYGYGGPISTTEDKYFLERAWSCFRNWCVENNVLAEFIRFHPFLENDQIFPGEIAYDRDVVTIALNNQDLLGTYSSRARTAIRKAQRNRLEIEWCQGERFMPLFREIYLDRMQELSADPFYLFSEEYFRVLTDWDNAHLAICSLNGELLAAAIFLYGNVHMEYHLSAATNIGKNFSATNLIIHEAALLAQRLGCKQLNLGGGTDSSPDNPLFYFKSSFSSLRASFRIGKQVHLPDRYRDLKLLWEGSNRPLSKRILFYR